MALDHLTVSAKNWGNSKNGAFDKLRVWYEGSLYYPRCPAITLPISVTLTKCGLMWSACVLMIEEGGSTSPATWYRTFSTNLVIT